LDGLVFVGFKANESDSFALKLSIDHQNFKKKRRGKDLVTIFFGDIPGNLKGN
jgi:hypothetical protein